MSSFRLHLHPLHTGTQINVCHLKLSRKIKTYVIVALLLGKLVTIRPVKKRMSIAESGQLTAVNGWGVCDVGEKKA